MLDESLHAWQVECLLFFSLSSLCYINESCLLGASSFRAFAWVLRALSHRGEHPAGTDATLISHFSLSKGPYSSVKPRNWVISIAMTTPLVSEWVWWLTKRTHETQYIVVCTTDFLQWKSIKQNQQKEKVHGVKFIVNQTHSCNNIVQIESVGCT